MIEIRLQGLGGDGVAKAAEWIGKAALLEGRQAQSFPFFGTEIRGAQVTAFIRIDDRPVRVRSFIYHPDIVGILHRDPRKLEDPWAGIKEGGWVILARGAGEPPPLPARFLSVPAGKVQGPWNVIFLGALAAWTGVVSLPALGEVMRGHFLGEELQKILGLLETGVRESEEVFPFGASVV
ncbi:MAG: 2-oxoacid:acceptor oxidoreductase family protein [Peptococcaceae bacterium]|nr:2-oxoacid:acceptor oxidoreductase family protein [Peptococcaceae bacterium]